MERGPRTSITLSWRADAAGLVVVLAATVLYIALAPDHILGGDNAEFVNLMRAGGIAHPPGYPLYTWYLRAFQWLPGTPAHAAAVATALLAGIQLLLLYAACRYWKAGPIPSAIAVGVYASSPLAILLSTQAEVFALNNLIASAILITSAPEAPIRGARRSITTGLLLGLGAAHHHTIILMAPLMAYGFIQGCLEEGRQSTARVTALTAGAFLAGASPNLLLFYWPGDQAVTASSWPQIHSAHDLANHFFRREYGLTDGHFSAETVMRPPLASSADAAVAVQSVRTRAVSAVV